MVYADGSKMKEVFEKAKNEKFAIVASNVANDITVKGVIQGAAQAGSDVLIQLSSSACKFEAGEKGDTYTGLRILSNVIKEVANEYPDIAVGINIDHGKPEHMDWMKYAIENELVSNVMIDASELDLDENIRLTKEIVDLAHSKGVLVEGEIGRIKGKEDEVIAEETLYTNPEDAVRFVRETGVDLFAAAIGTNHGVTKGKDVELRFDLLEQINQALKDNDLNAGLVLHGASGLTEEQQRKAVERGAVKINKDTRYQMEFAKIVQKYWYENWNSIHKPDDVNEEDYTPDKKRFDPRKWLKLAQDSMAEAAVELMNICGSSGKSVMKQ